jgi:uncharacterized protein (DUF427 family)
MSSRTDKPKKESVWDYPRPPRVEPTSKRIRVVFNGEIIAESDRTLRVLETSHPPVYYIPPEDVRQEAMIPCSRRTYCEFKGTAHYFHVRVGGRMAHHAAWSYPSPTRGYEHIAGCFSFYADLMEACYVDDERIKPQAGVFYGGWITSDILGPFKGQPGTEGW